MGAHRACDCELGERRRVPILKGGRAAASSPGGAVAAPTRGAGGGASRAWAPARFWGDVCPPFSTRRGRRWPSHRPRPPRCYGHPNPRSSTCPSRQSVAGRGRSLGWECKAHKASSQSQRTEGQVFNALAIPAGRLSDPPGAFPPDSPRKIPTGDAGSLTAAPFQGPAITLNCMES